MPVPLTGLAKNFKAIDTTSTTNCSSSSSSSSSNAYLDTSTSSTSSSTIITTTPTPSNYMRPQGLNNSNTSTMSSRSKLISSSSSSVNSSSAINKNNFQQISSGSYSKLKSKFIKENQSTCTNNSTNANKINTTTTTTPTLTHSNVVASVDSSSQSFSSIKESFKVLERSESQHMLLQASKSSIVKNHLTPSPSYSSSSSSSSSSTSSQYFTMPLKKSQKTNSSNIRQITIDMIAPLTASKTSNSGQHDDESSSSLLSSLSSTSSYLSLKENNLSKKSSENESEPSMATVSDKIKKICNETSANLSTRQQQQEFTKRFSSSSVSLIASGQIKLSSKNLVQTDEITNGICSNNSLSSAFNSDASTSPSCTSPNSNKALVGTIFVLFFLFKGNHNF